MLRGLLMIWHSDIRRRCVFMLFAGILLPQFGQFQPLEQVKKSIVVSQYLTLS